DRLSAYSVFAEIYYNITDRLKLSGGLRYTHERKYHSVTLDDQGQAFLGGGLPFDSDRTSFSNASPRVVLSYDAGPVQYYASLNRGFKSGGFNSPAFTIEPTLEPETITAYEAGAKFRSADGRIRLSGAGFYYDWKNVQVAFITGGGAGILQQ
ncbi:TonB-dependent receptor, partial [Escherichia coli]|nr:TonB-dependent receptor [Escherichia coli]